MGMPITAEENPIHDIFNGGKECVALDLKDPKNLKLMQKHARQGGRIHH